MSELEPCCVCQKDWNAPNDIIDTVYPVKVLSFQDGEIYSWNVICQLHNTGCGRVVYAESREEAIDRWNAGITDVIEEFNDEMD